mmetsp:Transcript_84256/g.161024  ORF Transcript_84256/g.161024 Transcript_84256/m.161024 type:complete len:392 (+) Transcript_84256:66-1241(+)
MDGWDLDDLDDDEYAAEIPAEVWERLHGPPNDEPEPQNLWEPLPPSSAVLFLDADAVLHHPDENQRDFFGESELALLRRIADSAQARIVLTSDYRSDSSFMQQVMGALCEAGINVSAVDAAPRGMSPEGVRAMQILDWLKDHAELVQGRRWLAIDQLDLGKCLPEGHALKINSELGLSAEDVDVAIMTLCSNGSGKLCAPSSSSEASMGIDFQRFMPLSRLSMPLCFSSPPSASEDHVKPLRFLAFGDSLTAGYCKYDAYGQFDTILIMAGTNDLGNYPPHVIVENIKRLHGECHQRGLRTVALAVPPSSTFSEFESKAAGEVNLALEKWTQSISSDSDQDTLFVNVEELLPLSNASLWDSDGVHFSAEGSRTLGFRLARLLHTDLAAREV